MEVKKQNYSTWIILFPKHKTRKLKIKNCEQSNNQRHTEENFCTEKHLCMKTAIFQEEKKPQCVKRLIQVSV